MELNADMKKQLMAMAGISDPSEFDNLVRRIVPAASSALSKEDQKFKSQQKSPFHIHFIKLIASIEQDGLDEFDKLDFDSQLQRVFDLVDKDRELNELFAGKPDQVTDRIEKSKIFRDRGNKLYAKREFAEAIREYGEAILMAGQGREAALALGNRSAVFYEVKDFSRCLDDIEAAMDIFSYPVELGYKLLDRKGRCLAALGDSTGASEAFTQAMTDLKCSNLKENKKIEFEEGIKAALESLPSNSTPFSSKDFECPFKIWDRHSNFPPLSDCLDIVYNDRVGRHVTATRAIRAGEALTIEVPIAAHLSPYKMTENCSNCFRKVGQGVLPSPLLPRRVRFCRLNCLKSAMDSYHPVEAAVDLTDVFYGDDVDSQLSGCISLAYRALSQKGLEFFKTNRERLFSEYDTKFGANIDTHEKNSFSYTGDMHYRYE